MKFLVILYEWWNDDNNKSSHELECKEVENHDKVMESHTSYLRLGHNSIKKFYDANNSRMFSVIMFLACI